MNPERKLRKPVVWCLAAVVVACLVGAVHADQREQFDAVIVDVSWLIDGSGNATGGGHGNFEAEPGKWRGFMFTADCGSRFMPSESRDDTVIAYWKKEPTRMVILLQEIGGRKISKCELKVSVRDDDRLYTRPGFQ